MLLSGFTLFKTSKGWQFSFREAGEDGWIVHVGYPNDKAQQVLELVGKLIPDVPRPPPVRAPGTLNLRPQRRTRVHL